jgi:hypothetical protein
MSNLLDIFKDLDVTYKSDGDKLPVGLDQYPTVPQLDREPVAIIKPDINQGPWIAGGAALRWYQGQTVGDNDIDVFCANAKQAAEVIEDIKSYGRYQVKHESENAVTIYYHHFGEWHTGWNIQIITRRYFSSLEEVIDNFDLTVCQIGTTGTEWSMAPQTAQDIRQRNLRFTLPLAADCAKRLTKYWVYGYRPVPGTLEAVIKNPNTRWKFDSVGDYENAF